MAFAVLGSDSVPSSSVSPTLLLVLGAPGETDYGSNFVRQARLWEQVARQAGAPVLQIGLDSAAEPDDRERLKQTLTIQARETTNPLWLVLIGHGTFDGHEARFNLRGPDLTAAALAAWLQPFRRPLASLTTASASAPFLAKLSATNRVVITATRSGNEQNYTRFGQYLAEALADPASDLDQDQQISLLEAFLNASHRVAEFYKTEGRLATEHALLDDNGDGLGTPADWFRGLRPVKKARDGATLDGPYAHQFVLVLSPAEQGLPPQVRARRDALELEVARLRESKSRLPETQYYQKLEALLLMLADLQAANEKP